MLMPNRVHSFVLIISLFIFVACGSSVSSDRISPFSDDDIPTPEPTQQLIKEGIHINEFMSSNLNTKMDRDYYKFSDWIELFNNSNQAVNIGGYFLSDDPSNSKKWQFPANTVVPPKGYLLIWADKKDKKKKELHTNFKLSSKKESILFSDINGHIIDKIDYKNQKPDISATLGSEEVVYMNPTPGSQNSTAYTTNKRTSQPVFSTNSGFYNNAISISISADDGANIYYTTDGSIPTKNSKLYTSAIPVDKITVINAIAIKDGLFASANISKTYIVNDESTLPVVSLSVSPKYLYDPMIGIYVDGQNGKLLPGCGQNDNTPHNFAQNWKRPAYISYFDESNKEIFTIGADIAISGQCSRYYKKKSFKVDLESKYGVKSINTKFYPDKNIKKIKDFKIRSGNRGYEIGDILASALTSNGNLNVDYQSYRTVRVFMNGEYWGVYNIREKKGDNFIKNNHPEVDKEKLDIIKNSRIAKEGSLDEYKKLNEIQSTSELVNLIDVDNFIDYVAMMIYSGNEDWSYANCRAWRENKPGAKWRWMLDDLDEGFNNYNAMTADNLNGSDGIQAEYHELSHIFNTLMSDPSVKAKFKQRFYHLLDTTFSPENVRNIANAIFAKRAKYVPAKEPSKWFIGEEGYDTLPHDYAKYKNSVIEFANKRRDIVKAQLDRF